MAQALAWYVTLILVAIVLLAFAFVAWRSGERADYPPVLQRSLRVRDFLFWGLVLLCASVTVFSLTDLPYASPDDSSAPRQVIQVTGRQWAWTLSGDQINVGEPVEFRVTSADVNHGFGLYDEGLRLLAQTQAMPGYVNVVHHVFTEPGTYRILCLEYCGLAHHRMMATLHVTKD